MLRWHFVETEPRMTRSPVGVCAYLDRRERTVDRAALQAGLGRTVSNAVAAVMEECVTLQAETVPVVWAGQVNTATKNVLRADLVPTAS